MGRTAHPSYGSTPVGSLLLQVSPSCVHELLRHEQGSGGTSSKKVKYVAEPKPPAKGEAAKWMVR